MFGMNDPAQTLLQLERYILDGRMEMSEVMAMQFTEMFLARKKRSTEDQIMLVKGLRILCDVLVTRGKGARACGKRQHTSERTCKTRQDTPQWRTSVA